MGRIEVMIGASVRNLRDDFADLQFNNSVVS